jgi:hypothetical protein
LQSFTGEHCTECASGFGPDCMQECDAERDCSGNGYCGADGSCVCLAPYTGSRCGTLAADMYAAENGVSDTQCTANMTCSGHGRCSAVERESCICDEGWGGAQCDSCAAGSTGENCDVSNESLVCWNEGRMDGEGLCVCREGFVGEICQECSHGQSGPECDVGCETGTTCTNGYCSGEGEGCVCEEGYAGEECEECAVGYGEECDEECDAERDCGGVCCVMIFFFFVAQRKLRRKCIFRDVICDQANHVLLHLAIHSAAAMPACAAHNVPI